MTGNARKYREAITVQRRTVTDSRGGQPLETWDHFAPRRAAVMATGQSDQVQHEQKVNSEDYTVETPFDASVAALAAKDLRILWRSRAGVITLNVLTVDVSQTGRGAEIVFKCRKDKA